MLENQRQCTECKSYKEIIDFPLHKTAKDGRSTFCKECIARYGRFYRQGYRIRKRRKRTIITPYERWLRFVSKVKFLDSGCWIYNAGKQWDRYGNVRTGAGQIGAHIYSYENIIGPIPDGLVVRHQCNIKRCVNPQHLLLGTYKDNIADAVRDGLLLRGSQAPRSKLTEKDVLFIREQVAIKAMTHKELAFMFNVSRSTVGYAVSGKNWKHL